jgi:hypothetical protein
MKFTKFLLAASAVASFAGVAQAAPAPLVIRFTGSSAFRGSAHTAIANLLDAAAGSHVEAWDGTSGRDKATRAIFTGTLNINSTPTYVQIKTYWTGSVGGVKAVTGNNALSSAWLTNSGTGAIVDADRAYETATAADVAMSDTYQSSTLYTSPGLTDQVIAVAGFKWVASKGAPVSLANINNQQVKDLYNNGAIPLSVFSGTSGDSGISVYALGRDPDSGTRLTAFAEAGLGANATVNQYQPQVSGSGTTNTGFDLVPQQTVSNLNQIFTIGRGGYSSGGNLASALGANCTNTTGYGIGYLSKGDAATAISYGAKELTYNGATYSDAAIQEGVYTFWGYEHLMYTTGIASDKKSVADQVGNQIKNTDANVSGLKLNTMHVSRPTDGGDVTPL